MQDIHDPNYSWFREHVLEKLKDIPPTTPSMYEWEKRGYDYGQYAAIQSGRERKTPYKKETLWEIILKAHKPKSGFLGPGPLDPIQWVNYIYPGLNNSCV